VVLIEMLRGSPMPWYSHSDLLLLLLLILLVLYVLAKNTNKNTQRRRHSFQGTGVNTPAFVVAGAANNK
jgi:hypothetical protein